jgi:PAS domain S-box-containing protein
MAKRYFWHSLTVRVTLLTLAIVMAGMWSLSLYTGSVLRMDMERQLGAQQFSTASFIAGNIDRELNIRLGALRQISATVSPELLDQPVTLQKKLMQLPVFQNLFTGGTFVTRLDGIAVASVDPTNRPLNNSAKDAEQLIAFLSAAQSSAVYISNSAPQGIQMAVPLHTVQGEPIGALVGVIDLTKPNFLDTIAKSKYGSSGSYRLYSPSQRRVVMATNLTANTATVGSETPNPNNSLMMNPPEGTSIGVDPRGVEALVSTKRIQMVDWSMSVMLPTNEAFAPVREQQVRIFFATALLTLVAGLLAWWILKRQLVPIMGALKQRNKALAASIALNQNTLDSVSAQIAVVDTTGRVMAVNQPWRKFVSNTYEECDAVIAIGSNFRTLFPDEKGSDDVNLQTLWSGIQSVLDGSTTTYTVESPLRSTQPSPWFHTNVTLLGSGGLGVVISRTDITVSKLADEQIRKLSRIAEQAPLSIVITNLHGAIEYTNPYFSEKTLYTAQEALGKNPSILRSGLTGSEVYQSLWQTLRKQQVWRGELHNRKKNGDLFVEHAVIAPVLDLSGQVTHYVALKEDITEAKQAEKNRLGLSLRIEEISRHLVRTQEETRQRFSQELHDRTSPNLAALGINLSIITRTIQKAPKSHEFDQNFADRIDDTRALIDDTNASIREICAGLHPAAIERAGLLSVVQNYAHQFVKRTAIQVRVSCPHNEIRLHADLELTLFRIVQEALTNCAKHAHAQTVDVRMRLDSHPILLCVSDDGCGFELQPSTGRAPFHGLGLINMRETVEFAGGSFKLESAPGFGTRIYVEI